PIKEILLDVAERGRSLGMILVGAQQTASEVERRLIANASIRVVGRLDAAEAGRPEYGFLPAVQRDRATIAKPGTMFVSQPEIPVPLVVAGDLYESAAPPAEAQGLVWSTLLDLRATGAAVVVVAGIHDNAAHFEALRPLAAVAGISVLGRVRRPDDGGVIDVTTGAGER